MARRFVSASILAATLIVMSLVFVLYLSERSAEIDELPDKAAVQQAGAMKRSSLGSTDAQSPRVANATHPETVAERTSAASDTMSVRSDARASVVADSPVVVQSDGLDSYQEGVSYAGRTDIDVFSPPPSGDFGSMVIEGRRVYVYPGARVIIRGYRPPRPGRALTPKEQRRYAEVTYTFLTTDWTNREPHEMLSMMREMNRFGRIMPVGDEWTEYDFFFSAKDEDPPPKSDAVVINLRPPDKLEPD